MTEQRLRSVGTILIAGLCAGALAACGGGGGTTAAVVAVTTPTPTPAPTAAPQVITMSLPDSGAMGQVNDPTYGTVGGYTEQVYSQVLAFVPGAQVMIRNGQVTAGLSHTLDVIGTVSGAPSFPATSPSITASGGSTLAAGYASGAVNPSSQIGPVTLSAGTYYIGCGFHYNTDQMRTVLVVAAAATPGPQATPVPNDTPPPNNGYGY